MKQTAFGRSVQRMKATLQKIYVWVSLLLITALNLVYWLMPYQTWCGRCGNYFDNILVELIGATLIYIVVHSVVRRDDLDQALLLRELRQRLDQLNPGLLSATDSSPKRDTPEKS